MMNDELMDWLIANNAPKAIIDAVVKTRENAHKAWAELFTLEAKARNLEAQAEELPDIKRTMLHWRGRAKKLQAQMDAVKTITEDSTLSWQDKHIATWKVVHPTAIKGEGDG